jgi:hypothetical protein
MWISEITRLMVCRNDHRRLHDAPTEEIEKSVVSQEKTGLILLTPGMSWREKNDF